MRQPAAARPRMVDNPQLVLEGEIRHQRFLDYVAQEDAAEAAARRARGTERPLVLQRRRYHYMEGRAITVVREC